MAEIRQTNFRLDQETVEKFRKFCDENGMNQADGFSYLMNLIDVNNTMVAAPSRKTEIESFQKHLKDMTQIYLNSVDLCTDAEARIRDEYRALIESKDITILDLQEKVKDLESGYDEAKTTSDAAAKAAVQAVKDAETAKKQADTAERLCDAKDETIAELKEKLVGYEDLKQEYATLQEKASGLDRKTADLQQQLKDQKKDSEYAIKTALMEKEREYIEKISRLQAELDLLKQQ